MKLAAIFSDGMVLQRDKDIYIFGESEISETIRIAIDNIEVSHMVQPGKWVIGLPAHAAGGPYEMVISTITGPEEDKRTDVVKVIKDILYGEVWLDNGQSNIEFELQNSLGGAEELKSADYPEIRYFKSIKAPVIDDDFLREEEKLCWHKCRNGDFAEMSGVGYYFSQKLYKSLGVPVGIVDCYQGGTSISCWLQESILESVPEGRIYLEEFKRLTDGQTNEEYLKLLNSYNEMVEEHLRLAASAKKDNPDITTEELREIAGDYPWPPPMGLASAFRPGGLIETMVKRIAPYTVRGIIYYQGEEDAVRNYEDLQAKSMLDNMDYEGVYQKLLRKLVIQYRKLFCEEALPIVVVQLPMFISATDEDVRKWAYIREAQEKVCKEYDAMTLVPLIDMGEYDNVHPVDKRSPGERIATEVLRDIYADEYDGAVHMSIAEVYRFDGGVVLGFENTFGDIVLKENKLIDIRKECTGSNVGDVSGLEIETAGTWKVPDRAEIDKEKIIIYEDEDVTGVRYGFFDYGKVNIYNNRSIPLAPFRVEVTA
ncbi:MAG: hypothetical protein J5684_01090 [Eubacterium sp.]|nr:hypothetical protein [Eubacterium sp.]